MAHLKTVGLAALALAVSAAALAVLLLSLESVALFRTDLQSALSWDNPLCSTLAAYRGLAKARRVTGRTDEIARSSRLVGGDGQGLFLFETPIGDVWMPQGGDLRSVAVVLAEQEQEMYGTAGGLGIRPGDIVIDAGAHVGLFTRTALASGASKVVTFEVTPKSNQALRRNLVKPIADGRVIVVEKGVWHEESMLPLVIVEGCSICNSVTHDMPATIEVPLTTIDRAVQQLGLTRVDFIKLDIENAEANALRGARETLAAFHPRVAVALENSKTRIAYAREILGIMREVFPGYEYECGACTNPQETRTVLPEVLHFFVP